MARTDSKISLPLTNIARKYGYIVWRKRDDEEVKKIFGEEKLVDLQIGKVLQEKKAIDWTHRRISITYTLTRHLPQRVTKIILRVNKNRVLVSFE